MGGVGAVRRHGRRHRLSAQSASASCVRLDDLAKPFYPMLNAYLTHGHFHVGGIAEWIFAELG